MGQWFKTILSYEIVLVIILIFLSALTHGINMFHYPYYENDEGTYLSRAWSLINFGKLSPENYRYDHAPGGTLFLALWTTLSGGFFTFGFSINSGRVLMFILQIASSLFLYLIARKLTNNPFLAAISVLFFTLSPLGIYFQRRILLDNMMVFWVLFSLTFLLYARGRLKRVFLSGLTLGIAVITKENAIFFIPGFLYLIFIYAKNRHLPTFLTWLTALSIPVVAYFSYALFKGEFFPYRNSLGGSYPRPSFIGTGIEQLQRGGGSIFDFDSLFWENFRVWFAIDPLIISLGILAILLNCYFGIRSVPNRVVALFSLLFILFLVRGGVILEFYIIPLLPFLALNITLVIWRLLEGKERLAPLAFVLVLGIILSTLILLENRSKSISKMFIFNETTPQVAAVDWILSQEQPQAFYVIDNYAYLDLHAKQDKHFKYSEYYWRVDTDPEVSQKILDNKWQNINYILMTPQMEKDITANKLPLTLTAWNNSSLIKDFSNSGWEVSVWKVNQKGGSL